MPSRSVAAVSGVVFAVGLAAAAPVTGLNGAAQTNGPAVSASNAVGFEGVDAGTRISSIDFGDVAATVTHTNGRTNTVFRLHDGYGAIAHEGDMAWKLAGGRVEFDFGGVQLDRFGFWYSDLEWATLRITAGSQTVDLRDGNSRSTDRFDLVAAPGESFDRVTLEFVGHQNDGVGFDGLTVGRATIPGPSGFAALAAGVAFASRRRRG